MIMLTGRCPPAGTDFARIHRSTTGPRRPCTSSHPMTFAPCYRGGRRDLAARLPRSSFTQLPLRSLRCSALTHDLAHLATNLSAANPVDSSLAT